MAARRPLLDWLRRCACLAAKSAWLEMEPRPDLRRLALMGEPPEVAVDASLKVEAADMRWFVRARYSLSCRGSLCVSSTAPSARGMQKRVCTDLLFRGEEAVLALLCCGVLARVGVGLLRGAGHGLHGGHGCVCMAGWRVRERG